MGATFQSILEFLPASELFPESIGILAGVEFGTPTRDGHCVNIGICRVTTDIAAIKQKIANPRCRFAIAHIIADNHSHLRFFFPKANILPCTERAIFSPCYFPVPHDYTLPEDLLAQLPRNAPNRIPAGKYYIRKVESGYWVEF